MRYSILDVERPAIVDLPNYVGWTLNGAPAIGETPVWGKIVSAEVVGDRVHVTTTDSRGTFDHALPTRNPITDVVLHPEVSRSRQVDVETFERETGHAV